MTETFTFSGRLRTISILLIVLGVAAVVGGYLYPKFAGLSAVEHTAWMKRYWGNLLLNNFYLVAMGLGATFFIAIQYVSNAGWSAGLKRIPEAMGSVLPVSFIFMLIIFYFGGHTLYHWTHDTVDPIILGKSGYLNEAFFFIRMAVFFGLWIIFWLLFRRSSVQEDFEGGMDHYRKTRRNSILFIIVFALSITFSGFDWLMSLDPHWFSTMFGVYTFAGVFVHSVAVMVLILILLKDNGYLKNINNDHYQDLGKYLFAFSTFWMYIFFFQFMLIWYANMPEETAYWRDRIGGLEYMTDGTVRYFYTNTLYLFIANFVINWFVPFLVLMSRNAKRKRPVLLGISVVLIVGYWLDLFLMIMPSLNRSFSIGFLELSMFLGFVGLFIFIVMTTLSKAPLQPQKHPFLEESEHHHI
ncbi:MAG: quinol:cytochrome C oxidoreductase [Spirochaetota bacterium]|nr:quinol:cytochrome C oxidoreductase [Spirochaetota bacterium]